MARIFGYLLPTTDASRTEADARHAATAARCESPVQSLQLIAADGNQMTATCYALHVLEKEGVIVSISEGAIWRGRQISSDNDRELLAEIADRFESSGEQLLNDLTGQFVIAIQHPRTRRAMLAVDRMGVERVTFAETSGGLVFGSLAHEVARFPGVGRSIRQQALYDFLIFHMVPAPQTVYQNVSKLQPGTALLFEDGAFCVKRYWMPRYDYVDEHEIPALIEELHVCLQEVIRKPGARSTTGSFLSGGLDSSSISGTLARVSDTAAKTFSVGFGDNEYDELKFARIAIEEFECDSFEYQMTPQDIVNVFPKIAAQFDEPFGNSSAAPTYFCAKLAADNGVSDLLAGDGGDEIFGGNERYVRHRIFEFYNRLPGWLRTGLIEPATRLVHPDSRVMPLRKARSYVDQALIPLPERFESWNLAYREGSEQMLTTQFSESIDKDGPFQIMQSVWNAAPSDDLLEKMLWYDWHFTLADSDLRKVGTMCELANVRVSYPLLSDPIVALSNRVHPKMKINGTDLRVFFKDAMKGFLPPQIINKKKHGFGLPFGLWLKTDSNLRDLIYTNLSGLKKRQIVRTDFIDNVVQAHHAGHASYYGYILWDLAMLEAWLACHEDSASIGNT